MKLQNKVVVVTGASSGMGREIANLFAKEGATVYAVARRLDKLNELASGAKEFTGKIIPYAADLTNKQKRKKVSILHTMKPAESIY